MNPFNRDLSPGGSSGGESTLIAAHGSPLGVGTDIGGSIVSYPGCHAQDTLTQLGTHLANSCRIYWVIWFQRVGRENATRRLAGIS